MILNSNDNSYYVYSHVRKDTGEVFYYGKGKGNRAYEPNRNRWHDAIVKKVGFTVVILLENLTDEEAKKEEIRLILEAKSKGLKLTNQTEGGDGVGGKASSRGGSLSKELKLGIHAPGAASKGGIAGAKTLIEKRLGLFGRSKEKMSEDGKKAGRLMFQKKLGIFSFSEEKFKEVRSKGGKSASEKQREAKKGIFSLSKSELSLNAKKAGSITSSQKWKCLECELITSPGNIGNHQKATGHIGKLRIF